MKWETADFKVGITVLGAIAMLLATLVWLSPAFTDRSAPLYTTYDRIDGIAVQSPVLLRGYQIGRVSGIEPELGPGGSLVFRVRMKIDWTLSNGERVPIPLGTRARLVPPPIFGSGYISLEPQSASSLSLSPGMTIPGVRTDAALDQMQALADSLGRQMSATLATARSMMDTMSRTASTANSTALYARNALPALFSGLQQELAVGDSLMREMRAVAPATVASIDTAQALLQDSHKAVVAMGALMDARQPEINRMIANLDTTSALLSSFMRQIARRPYKVFTGVTPPEAMRPAPPRTDTVTSRPETTCAGNACIMAKRDTTH